MRECVGIGVMLWFPIMSQVDNALGVRRKDLFRLGGVRERVCPGQGTCDENVMALRDSGMVRRDIKFY